MASSSSPDYKALFLRAEEERGQEKDERRRAEEERDRIRTDTTNDFSGTPSRSTKGKMPPPIGKCCPLQLLHWTDCAARQQKIYRSVCNYLEPPGEAAARLFSPHLELEGLGKRFLKRATSKLCKIPAARDEFHLGDGIWFDNHTNALDPDEADQPEANESSSSRRPRPDQFCIHRVNGVTNTFLTTNLRAGLRPMRFWKEVVMPNSIPTEEPRKLRYNAAQAQRILYYHLCEPNMEVNREDDPGFLQPVTAIARVLCLCLMSFDSRIRNQNPPGSEYTSVYTSSERTVSEYLPSSSPVESATDGRRLPTQSRAYRAPSNTTRRGDFSDSDTDPAPGGRKRGFSQVTSSPSMQRSARQTSPRRSSRHLINDELLVQQIKQQLDENIDRNCTPMTGCGALGAPFKITCTVYGYTVVGKGTTSRLWTEVSREADVYLYFLHGAGAIQHMLLMAWGGEPNSTIQHDKTFGREISRSKKEICFLGILHQDLRLDNILWNAELKRH
ncbi:hypothetical protein BDV29DRAFT_187492 [Aspergillus leporis]|uniref:Protein kinase domain-containing protein n=1 Tax=Aspergillus leporis TaxID=41062 RepID=A0A5N5XHM4_9EURO|nr:hypothetical protein BDV29DRAFT_187492 [Aspergillus leporis]